MTNEPKSGQAQNSDSVPEELSDESLDQAEGGFSLSGKFTTTTTVNNFVDVNISPNTADGSGALDTVDTNMLRTRPGRIGW